MPRKRKLRCFIAMAFGHADTDRVYDDLIVPVLRSKDIDVKPLRVDRREFNTDINVKIIELLSESDFCIADLTYARQSVYFEAGYAQRVTEVIYTARADHLVRDQPDDQRVHFDLDKKNIVKWKNPGDLAFSERLKRRIRTTVVTPFKRLKSQEDKLCDDRAKFSCLSQSGKLALIRKNCMNMIMNRRFSLDSPSLWRKGGWLSGSHVAQRVLKNKLQVIVAHIQVNFTVNELYRISGSYIYGSPRFLEKYVMADMNSVEEHQVFFALSKIRPPSISKTIPDMSRDQDGNRYLLKKEYIRETQLGSSDYVNRRSYNSPAPKKQIEARCLRKIHLYFESNIDSESAVKTALRKIFQQINE